MSVNLIFNVKNKVKKAIVEIGIVNTKKVNEEFQILLLNSFIEVFF